jgi:arylformamidase
MNTMNHVFHLLVAVAILSEAQAQDVKRDIPYANPAHERQVLDVYSAHNAKNLPVVFWIHGGGWQTGDKASVQIKPQAFMDKGFVFVSTNYRLLPSADMATIVRDIAKSIRWVHDHIAEHGGDPNRLFIMGHSAGAQLAALICTDDRYLKAEGLSLAIIKGCVPFDGDTYDVPAIIETAETRRRVHGLPQAKFGHREKFGNDPEKHRDFSAVTHVAKDKGIPPFLILHVAEHADTTAQAQRLGNALKEAGVPVTVFGAKETTHNKINADLGLPDDPATKALFEFLGNSKVAVRREGKKQEITPPATNLQEPFFLHVLLRQRLPAANEPDRFEVVQRREQWDPKKTAIIVCDMWDLHHCKRAVDRVKEMAPRMNEVIAKARDQGVFIIHAPSECMAAYENTPMRQRAKNPPPAKNLPKDIASGCDRIPAEEKGRYPIDQSDGGEDDQPAEHSQWAAYITSLGRNPKAPWMKEIDVLEIKAQDAVSDSGVEIWNLLEERGIHNVMLMGVHTNMCVLGRPFGLRQMAKNGKHVVLMRDLTDTMYNPARWPYVSHFEGTERIIEHIEKFVCPTTTSEQILGGKPFRFEKEAEVHRP